MCWTPASLAPGTLARFTIDFRLIHTSALSDGRWSTSSIASARGYRDGIGLLVLLRSRPALPFRCARCARHRRSTLVTPSLPLVRLRPARNLLCASPRHSPPRTYPAGRHGRPHAPTTDGPLSIARTLIVLHHALAPGCRCHLLCISARPFVFPTHHCLFTLG